ncbi:MAG TPA: hypothetical protein VFC31_07415 [Candidatus Limnocylindria bacterium]|nr:hypothetical protein [Candidatus Limnocylindria bacterium]
MTLRRPLGGLAVGAAAAAGAGGGGVEDTVGDGRHAAAANASATRRVT